MTSYIYIHIRVAFENSRILTLLTYFTYLLTYFDYFRSSSSKARKKLKPKLEPRKARQEQPDLKIAYMLIRVILKDDGTAWAPSGIGRQAGVPSSLPSC